jgi:hypothetical protein
VLTERSHCGTAIVVRFAGNKIAMFFEDIAFEGSGRAAYSKDIEEVMRHHVESFEANGWQVVPVGLEQARCHPKFPEFEKLDWLYAMSRNPPSYTRICYLRWLAYAAVGLPFADLDVINFGMTPADAEPLFHCETPPLICHAHSVGICSPHHYEQIICAFEAGVRSPELRDSVAEDLNDMTLLKASRPEWAGRVFTFAPLIVGEYRRMGWDSAKLVHFPHGVTPLPRSEAIQKALDDRRERVRF